MNQRDGLKTWKGMMIKPEAISIGYYIPGVSKQFNFLKKKK